MAATPKRVRFWTGLTSLQQAGAVMVAIAIVGWGAHAEWTRVDTRIEDNKKGLIVIVGDFQDFKTKYTLADLRRKLWLLEDRYGRDGCPEAPKPVRDECRNLSNQIMAILASLVK